MSQSTENDSADHAPTFALFNHLPAELRRLIWEMALPEPRIDLLEHKERQNVTSKGSTRIDKLGFSSRSPPPEILTVCREAFEVTVQHYPRAFTNKNGTSIPQVYFDFRRDFLYLGPEWFGPREIYDESHLFNIQERVLFVLKHELNEQDLSRVENLAIWRECEITQIRPGYGYDLYYYILQIVQYFGKVKRVAVVYNTLHPEEPDYGTLRFLEVGITKSIDIGGDVLISEDFGHYFSDSEVVTLRLPSLSILHRRFDGRLDGPIDFSYEMISHTSVEEDLLEIQESTT